MGLLNSLNISAQGLKTHSMRVDVHTKNIANIDTPNYVRKIPVLMAREDISFSNMMTSMRDQVYQTGATPFATGGVVMPGVLNDPTEGDLIYKPGHPEADENGYVRASNVNPMVDMADAMMATRAYEANLAVAAIIKAMAQRAADMGKG